MRILVTAAIALVLGIVSLAPVDRAGSNATPAAPALHPIVGSWKISGGAFYYTFGADGTVIASARDGAIYHGAWRADGATDVAYLLETAGGEGQYGSFSIVAGGEIVGSDGALERLLAPARADITMNPATPQP